MPVIQLDYTPINYNKYGNLVWTRNHYQDICDVVHFEGLYHKHKIQYVLYVIAKTYGRMNICYIRFKI
jgi:hypothetical protein